MKTAASPIKIVRAEGALLFDEEGKSYIDAIGSWWVNLHGHAHPHISHCIGEQAKTLPHVMFAGFTHEPAQQLCERLQRWLPKHLNRFFFSDNGSTATEIALKMAIQFRHMKDAPEATAEQVESDEQPTAAPKYKVIALEGSYHGDTFGAMSVGERDVFVRHFEPYLFDVIYVPAPTPGNEKASRRAMKRAVEDPLVAAFIFEPLIQGAFGMRTHEPNALDELLSLCRERNIFTIADEVMTGFFRTGTCFAVHQLKTQVDFICLSKALTGGNLPLALTVTTPRVFDAFYHDEKSKAFFHGHSYTANPIGCAAAIASLDLIESGGFKPNLKRVTQFLEEKAEVYRSSDRYSDVRQLGVMLALELNVPEKVGYLSEIGPRLYNHMMKAGVHVRPLGEVIYVLPPVCISDQQLDQVFRAIDDAVEQIVGG